MWLRATKQETIFDNEEVGYLNGNWGLCIKDYVQESILF